ncbi:MAG: hypothetical protein ACR2OZ_19105 [Verrucomicrobiales bacterium]
MRITLRAVFAVACFAATETALPANPQRITEIEAEVASLKLENTRLRRRLAARNGVPAVTPQPIARLAEGAPTKPEKKNRSLMEQIDHRAWFFVAFLVLYIVFFARPIMSAKNNP